MATTTEDLKQVRIVLNGIGQGRCYLGDDDISKDVFAIVIRANVGQITKVELHVYARVEFDGPAEITTIVDQARRYENG